MFLIICLFIWILVSFLKGVSLYYLNSNLLLIYSILLVIQLFASMGFLIIKSIKYYNVNKKEDDTLLKMCFSLVTSIIIIIFIIVEIKFIVSFSNDLTIKNYYLLKESTYFFNSMLSFLFLLILYNFAAIELKKEKLNKKNYITFIGIIGSIILLYVLFFITIYKNESIKTDSYKDIYAIVTYYDLGVEKEEQIIFEENSIEIYLTIDNDTIVYIDYYYLIDDSHTGYSSYKEYTSYNLLFWDKVFVGVKTKEKFYVVTIKVNEE